MSVRETTKLNKIDLRYLLIDSLRLYSDNVVYIDGSNPYRFSINKKTFYILIKNVHESGNGRGNQDESRIQVSKTRNFNQALSSGSDVIVLGYFADERTFTAWNPFMMRDRFNEKDNVSLYTRFSEQRKAREYKISNYRDTNNQSIISFIPDYLGLYLENIQSIHLLQDKELIMLVEKSDQFNQSNEDGEFSTSEGTFTITHARAKRDPLFSKKIYEAYNNKCAMCGIGLECIEAAHIVPHAHELGTDEISNGVSLCALHHTAYDKSLIYFDVDYHIFLNEEKIEYLEKVGLDSGLRKFEKMSFENLQLPMNQALHPNPSNIKIANLARGITK